MARNRQKAKERQARRRAKAQSGDGKRTPPPSKPPRREPPVEPEASDNGRDGEGVVDPHLAAGAPPEDVGRSDEVLEYVQDLDASAEESEEVVPAEDGAKAKDGGDGAAGAKAKAKDGDADQADTKAEDRDADAADAKAEDQDAGTADARTEDRDADPAHDFAPAEDIAEDELTAGTRGHRATAERHANRPRFVQFLFAVSAELQRVQWPDRQALTTLTGVVLGFVVIAGSYLGLLDAIFSEIVQAIL